MEQSANKFLLEPLANFDRSRSVDEMNLCEFPLAAITHRPDPQQKTLVFEDDIFDEGAQQNVHRKLIVSGSDAYGLPTPLDSDVLLTMAKVTDVRNSFTSPKVPFTRYEFVKFMGWDTGGKSYRRLEESFNRWASVTLYYNHAWWDKTGRAWRSRTFHVLEALDLRGRECSSGESDLSTFTWNEVLFSSFQARNLKSLDLDKYFSLHSAAAKQMYRFLDKRFHCKKRLRYDLRLFACEHIGLSRSYDNGQLKRRIHPSIEELESIGFLAPMSFEQRYEKRCRAHWDIHLHHWDVREAASKQEASNDGVFNELTRRGIDPRVADTLLRQYPTALIEDKLQFHDSLLARGDKRCSRNPAGFLVEAIRRDFKERPGIEAEKPKLRAKLKTPKRETQVAAVDERAAEFERFWRSLPESEQAALESKAVETGNRFQVETYRRLQGSGSSLFEQVRLQLIRDFVEAQDLIPAEHSSFQDPAVAHNS